MYEQEIFLILFLKKKKKRERSLGKGSNGQMISFRGQFDTSLPKVLKLVGQSRLETGGTNSQRTFRLDSSLIKPTNFQHSQGWLLLSQSPLDQVHT